MLIIMHKRNEIYKSQKGHTMQRENGKTPNGNELNGRWVLRSPDNEFVDFDDYHQDLANRNGLILK